jgi:hypothetical protein
MATVTASRGLFPLAGGLGQTRLLGGASIGALGDATIMAELAPRVNSKNALVGTRLEQHIKHNVSLGLALDSLCNPAISPAPAR